MRTALGPARAQGDDGRRRPAERMRQPLRARSPAAGVPPARSATASTVEHEAGSASDMVLVHSTPVSLASEHEHLRGPLEEAAKLGEERRADRAVDDAVIARERHRSRLPGTTAPSQTTGSSRTWPTARMAPSGGLMTAANASMPNMPRFEMENVPSVISSARASSPWPRGEIAHLAGDGDDALLVGVAHDRRDQPVGDGDGDRDVDAVVDEERLGREARVALGHADERDGAGLDEQIVERDLERCGSLAAPLPARWRRARR